MMPYELTSSLPLLREGMLWLSQQPILSLLLLLMLSDIVAGTLVAITTHKASSSASWRGMSRKAMTLLVVAVGILFDPIGRTYEVPIANLVASFYVITEAWSILENAAALGVPLPGALVDILVKLRTEAKAPPTTDVVATATVHVTPASPDIVAPTPKE